MTPHILLIDNYDSFTYNLAQAFLAGGADVDVRLNDAISIAEALALRPTHLVVSPGPGTPCDAGVSIGMIQAMAPLVPVLGVCLGHQAIVEAFGGAVVRARAPMHGKATAVTHDESALYDGIPARFEVGRYHSLVADRMGLPPALHITSTADDGEIMGVRHKSYPVWGVQFHPESVLTPCGARLLKNFIGFESRGPVS